jgi:hypothetical protein
MGGRFTRSDILCGKHNGLCSKWADTPLCEQFSFAIHALEVRKGDGCRGTTLLLKAEDGTRFDALPDFRFRMHPKVERDDNGGFIITATESGGQKIISKQLSAITDPSTSRTESRNYVFWAPFSTHGPGMRGVLKAALHFVAAIADDYDRAREICQDSSSSLFCEMEPPQVTVVPYDVTDNECDVNRHEMVAWNGDNETFVRVKFFNLITYLVRLPHIALKPRVFRQNTRDGSRTLSLTLAPYLIVRSEMASIDGFRFEFIHRIDAIANLGDYKSDVVNIMDCGVRDLRYRMALGDTQRFDALNEILREKMVFRKGPLPRWAAKELVNFANRRIAELARIHS